MITYPKGWSPAMARYSWRRYINIYDMRRDIICRYGEHGSPSGWAKSSLHLGMSAILNFPKVIDYKILYCKTFMWNLHLNIWWPMIETFFRPKSTYGLDHDFKYIVSQDSSRVVQVLEMRLLTSYIGTDHDLWRSYFFHLFFQHQNVFKWFSIYNRSPRCRWDVGLYDGTQVEEIMLRSTCGCTGNNRSNKIPITRSLWKNLNSRGFRGQTHDFPANFTTYGAVNLHPAVWGMWDNKHPAVVCCRALVHQDLFFWCSSLRQPICMLLTMSITWPLLWLLDCAKTPLKWLSNHTVSCLCLYNINITIQTTSFKKTSQINLDRKSTRRIKKASDSIDLRGFDLENLQVWTLGMTGFLQSVTAACILADLSPSKWCIRWKNPPWKLGFRFMGFLRVSLVIYVSFFHLRDETNY